MSANTQPVEDDGCTYMTAEEAEAFRKMATPSPFDPSKVKYHTSNVRYGKLPEQLLDIYLPEAGEKPYPVVFYVHGGGWSMGSKTEGFLDGAIGLTQHGYAVLSVDYRLAPKTKFPEFIFDVKTAVRWARAHAEDYGFDPARFGMAGDSAGGHITLMLGFTAGRPEYAGERYGWVGFPDDLQAICDMYGPTDLATPMADYYQQSGVARPNRGAPSKPSAFAHVFGTGDANLLRLISPLSLVHPGIPPTLILHGAKDGVVPYQHSTLLAQRIDEVCGPGRAELVLYEDRNHADFGFNTAGNSDRMAAFFDRYLKDR